MKQVWGCLLMIGLSGVMACQQTDEKLTQKMQVREALDYYYQGTRLQERNNFDDALAAYRQSIAVSPRPITYYRIAEVLAQQGKFDESIEAINQSLKLSPGFRQAEILKQRIELRQTAALAAARPATSEPDELDLSRLDFDSEVQLDENVQKVLETEPDAVDLTPTNETETPTTDQPETFTQETQVTSETTPQVDKSTPESSQVEIIGEPDASNANHHYQLGLYYYSQNQLEPAETEFRKCIELDNRHAQAYNDLGVVLQQKNQLVEAERAYQRAVDIGNNPDAFFNLALLKEKQGDYKTSIELYQKYVEIEPASSFTAYARQRIEKLRRLAY